MVNTKKLIELVEKYPILYDQSHEDYKNVRKKDKVWNGIGKELDESGEELKKKWKNLKDSYMRYIKTSQIKPIETKIVKKWQWSDHMKTFRPFFVTAKTSPIIKCDIAKTNSETEEDCPQTIDTIPTKQPPDCAIAPKPKKKRKRIDESTGPSSTKPSVNHFESTKTIEMDEIDLLFLAHGRTIKTFSKKRQAIAKMKISQVIMEQELLNIEEQSTTEKVGV